MATKTATKTKKTPKPRKPSALEEAMAFQMEDAGLPAPVREHRFHPERLWRFDFAWPEQKLALEVQGGAWTGGRHARGGGLTRDAEKLSCAVLMGWRVLVAAAEHVHSGDALEWVELALSKEAA